MEGEPKLIVVLSTVETTKQADDLAALLVDQSLAACVQIDGPIRSRYRWAGKTESSTEYRLMIKSSLAAWPKLKEKMSRHHPYEEPEIVMMEINDASVGYRDWVVEQTT